MRYASLSRIAWAFLAGSALLVANTQAQETVTKPAAADATTAEALDAGPPRVLVLPFEAIAGDTPENAAIAQSTQRNLVRDLSGVRRFHVEASEKVAPDRAAAVATGKDAAAQFVVWGTVQFVEGRLRITGEVLDLSRGDDAGDDFKLTGTLKEFFEMQDLVTEQVTRRLPEAAPPREMRAEDARDARDAQDRDAPPEVPAGEPLTMRRPVNKFDPDWLEVDPDGYVRDDGVSYRYAYGPAPYLPTYGGYYGYGRYPFGPAYGGYHYSFYRPYRALYQHRSYDYTYRGIPDRRPYYGFGPQHIRSFSGPVPLRWYHQD